MIWLDITNETTIIPVMNYLMPALHPSNDQLGEDEILITKNQITQLMLESHKKAVNTMEEIAALKEIAKLNGMYEAKTTTVNVLHIEQNVSRLEEMTDEELLMLAGKHDVLNHGAIEAEYEEIEDA